jgi:hypothetical protein
MTEHHRAPEPTPDRTADLSPGRERTIDVPGATIASCVIGDLASVTAERPPLMLFGSPMDRTGFGSLAARLPGRVLVLVDPRNTGRSVRADRDGSGRVDEHAADLHAVITDLGVGTRRCIRLIGRGTQRVALVAAHPDDVRMLVAHEPPVAALLPDAAAIGALCDAMIATRTTREGAGPAMAPVHRTRHAPRSDRPATSRRPDPAMFGFPTDDDGTRDDPLMANMRGGGVTQIPRPRQRCEPRGAASSWASARRAADHSTTVRSPGAPHTRWRPHSARDVTVFPGGHDGFLGGEFGQMGRPDEFAGSSRCSTSDELAAARSGTSGAGATSAQRACSCSSMRVFGQLTLRPSSHFGQRELAAVRAPHRGAARRAALLPDRALHLGQPVRGERAAVAVAHRPGRSLTIAAPGTCRRRSRSRRT